MSGVYGIAFAVSLAFCKEPAYAYLNHDNSKLRSYPLKCLHNVVLTEFLSKPETRKKYFYKGLYGPTILLSQNAREHFYVPMYRDTD